MIVLTLEQRARIELEIHEYYLICPPMAQRDIDENLNGFVKGWVCRAAFENDKRKDDKSLDFGRTIAIVSA